MLVFFAQKSAGETNADTIAQPDTIKEATNDNSWQIILRDIALNRGKIRYADDIIDIDWTMHHIELNIPEIDLSGSGTKAQLYFDFARGGSLALNAMFDQPTMDYELNCKISDYPVGVLMPFMKGVVNVGNVAGSLGIDLHAQGNIDNIMASILDGSIQLDSTYVDDINGQRLISLNHFKTDIEHIDIAHGPVFRLWIIYGCR